MLRIYGQILSAHPGTVVVDSIVFSLLAEKKLGPAVYGVFPTGRIEEYVEVWNKTDFN